MQVYKVSCTHSPRASFAFCCCDKTSLGKKGLIWLAGHSALWRETTEGAQGRNQGWGKS